MVTARALLATASALAVVGFTVETAQATETVPTPPPPPSGLAIPERTEPTESDNAVVAQKYAQRFNVSESEAERRLTLQRDSFELDAVLREQLADDYGGVHFDNEAGALVISAASPDTAQAAPAIVREHEMSDRAVRVREVSASLDDLEEIQEKVDRELAGEIGNAQASTAIDTSANTVLIRASESLPQQSMSRVNAVAEAPHVRSKTVPPEQLRIRPDACGWPYCSRPLRGAVRADLRTATGSPAGFCTTGFIGYTTTQWMMFTAGHCGVLDLRWHSREYPGPTSPRIGGHAGWYYGWGEGGDAAIIRTGGTQCQWCPNVTTPIVAAWTANEAYPIVGRSWSYVGMFLCRLGATTSIRCGTVTETNVTVTYVDGVTLRGMFRTSACSGPGDSGGPYPSYNYAVGIHSGGTVGGCSVQGATTIAQEVLRAEAGLGAWVHSF